MLQNDAEIKEIPISKSVFSKYTLKYSKGWTELALLQYLVYS